ncbi:hypothetical protein ACFWMJ_40615 [Streptomyces hawaiiensis]|uniref:hypothetical protein n=1 Tax=Streptomyces hawaiiensis TaxID=67305 RepID=UPI003667C61A
MAKTGDRMAWKHTQERGRYRNFHTPAEAFRHTWQNDFDHLRMVSATRTTYATSSATSRQTATSHTRK